MLSFGILLGIFFILLRIFLNLLRRVNEGSCIMQGKAPIYQELDQTMVREAEELVPCVHSIVCHIFQTSKEIIRHIY